MFRRKRIWSTQTLAHRPKELRLRLRWLWYGVCGIRGNLHSHKRKHTGERPYACDYAGCGKAFAQRFNLVAHVRTHTGTKPYACDYPGCGKAFAQPGNRDIHMRTHTGEKPYVCDVPGCNYASTQPGHLHEHVRIHHNATYVARKKEQEERVRKALLDAGWKEWFHPELLPPAGYFKREHQIDFECAAASADRQFCRIDFILGYDGPSYVFLEVDEHQHRFGFRQADGAAISCDAKRMGSVHTSLAVEFGKLGATPRQSTGCATTPTSGTSTASPRGCPRPTAKRAWSPSSPTAPSTPRCASATPSTTTPTPTASTSSSPTSSRPRSATTASSTTCATLRPGSPS